MTDELPDISPEADDQPSNPAKAPEDPHRLRVRRRYLAISIAMVLALVSALPAAEKTVFYTILSVVSLVSAAIAVWLVWSKMPRNGDDQLEPLSDDISAHLSLQRTIILLWLVAGVISATQWLIYFDSYSSALRFNLVLAGLQTLIFVSCFAILIMGWFRYLKPNLALPGIEG